MSQHIKDGKCPFCPSKKFNPLTVSVTSDVICDECSAIFKSPRLLDSEEAGKFTGRYGQVKKENLVKFGFNKNKEK